ncbi:MAG TPA: hypothetical protein VK003_10085 [Oceanobacillus sp.]|nr:hypothetical protein [Oceanobacillus sp.]
MVANCITKTDHPPKAAPMFGWSCAIFIELALDETWWRKYSE